MIFVKGDFEIALFEMIASSVKVVLYAYDKIAEKVGAVVPDKNTLVYIYCRSGRRSAIAVEAMRNLGYTNLTDLGGMDEAKKRLRK
jgi:phage shock protein E